MNRDVSANVPILLVCVAVGSTAALLHVFVAFDSVLSIATGSSQSGAHTIRAMLFGALAVASAGLVSLANQSPRRLPFVAVVLLVLLALAFTDLRHVGLDTI